MTTPHPITFNISYSLLSLYKNSPLQFYYEKILKSEPDTQINQAYGNAGQVVHKAIELYITEGADIELTCLSKWREYNLTSQEGMSGKPLSYKTYLACAKQGQKIVDDLRSRGYVLEPEVYIKFPLPNDTEVTVKGYVDLIATHPETGDIIVCDWKTNSSVDDEHEAQRLFYTYLIHTARGKLPSKLTWYYLKIDDHRDTTSPSVQVAIDQEQTIRKFLTNVREWGTDITKYECGNWDSPFNAHKKKCAEMYRARINQINPNEMVFNLTIKNGMVFITTPIPQILVNVLDQQMMFDDQNKYFMQQVILNRCKGKRPANFEEIGRTHLFNTKFHACPLGYYAKLLSILRQYCEYNKKELKVIITEGRDPSVLGSHVPMSDKLVTDITLRDDQLDAIKTYERSDGCGFLEIGTGGGKTIITAEIIRRKATRTLWIIDRKELLRQTKTEFEKLLNMPLGMIGDGECDIQDVTLATIQTLSRDVAKYAEYLKSVNFVIVDESHHSGAASYKEVLTHCGNTKFRLGTTATAKRKDGKEPIMFSLLGEIIYRFTTKDLIAIGSLMAPTITFIKLHQPRVEGTEYAKVYKHAIVENNYRNQQPLSILPNFQNKKVLILISIIQHGEMISEILTNAGYTSFFIHGSVDTELRKQKFTEFKDGALNILVGTSSIFSEGVNIPSLSCVINMSANRAENRTIQGIGRVLRTAAGKESAHYYDFIDNAKFLDRASRSRMTSLKREGHNITIRE